MPGLRCSRVAASVCACILALAACGGGNGESLVAEESLRDCLAAADLEIQAPQATAGAGLGNVSPDFRAITTGGVPVDLIVQNSDAKARRSAADIRAALQSFGVASTEVVSRRNAIAVIGGAASEADLGAIERCLGG